MLVLDLPLFILPKSLLRYSGSQLRFSTKRSDKQLSSQSCIMGLCRSQLQGALLQQLMVYPQQLGYILSGVWRMPKVKVSTWFSFASFFYSLDLNVWFTDNDVRKNLMLVTFGGQIVEITVVRYHTFTVCGWFRKESALCGKEFLIFITCSWGWCWLSHHFLQMCTATLQRQAEEDQVQTQVVIPNQDDQTELHKITMYHPDNRSSRIKGSHRLKC